MLKKGKLRAHTRSAESVSIARAWRALDVVLQYVAGLFGTEIPEVHGLKVDDVFDRVFGASALPAGHHDDLESRFLPVSDDEAEDSTLSRKWKAERRKEREEGIQRERQELQERERQRLEAETDEERSIRIDLDALRRGGQKGLMLLWSLVHRIAERSDVGLISDPYPYEGLHAGTWNSFETEGINYDDWTKPRFEPSKSDVDADDDVPNFPEGYSLYACGILTSGHISALLVDTRTRSALFVDSNGTKPDDLDGEVEDNPLPTTVAIQKIKHTLRPYVDTVDMLVDFNAQRDGRVCSSAALFAITVLCLTKNLNAAKDFLLESVYSLDLPFTVFNEVMSVFAAKMLLMFEQVRREELHHVHDASTAAELVDIDFIFNGAQDYSRKSRAVGVAAPTTKNKGVVQGVVRVLLTSTVGGVRRLIAAELAIPLNRLLVRMKQDDGVFLKLPDTANVVDVFPYERGVLYDMYVTETTESATADGSGSSVVTATSSGGLMRKRHQWKTLVRTIHSRRRALSSRASFESSLKVASSVYRHNHYQHRGNVQ